MNAVGLAIVGVAALADVAAAAANLYGTHDLFTSAASPASVLVDVTNVYSPNGLQTLNSFLTDAEAKNDAMLNGTDCDSRSFFATCYDTPAIGSGLTLHSVGSDGTIHLMGVTDRGPNQDCGDISDDFTATPSKYTYPSGYGGPSVSTGKGFPVPKFSPTVIKGTLDKTNSRFVLDKACNLKRATAPSGLTTDVTGLPTNVNDDTPYDGWCRTALAYDQGGQDVEDIQPIPGTNYAVVVDEYNPSISVINIDFSSTTDCGMVKVRYVPESISLPNAGYTVKNILPRSYDQRRANRGLEGVAVSQDGKTAAAFMQSCNKFNFCHWIELTRSMYMGSGAPKVRFDPVRIQRLEQAGIDFKLSGFEIVSIIQLQAAKDSCELDLDALLRMAHPKLAHVPWTVKTLKCLEQKVNRLNDDGEIRECNQPYKPILVSYGTSGNGKITLVINIAKKLRVLADAFWRIFRNDFKAPQNGPKVLEVVLEAFPRFEELLSSEAQGRFDVRVFCETVKKNWDVFRSLQQQEYAQRRLDYMRTGTYASSRSNQR